MKKILLGTAALLALSGIGFAETAPAIGTQTLEIEGGVLAQETCADYAKKVFERLGALNVETPSKYSVFAKTPKEPHYSIGIRCETPHSIVFLVVAGPNYDDAVEILKIIADTWGQGGKIQ
jgi:hypothetical protein